jgi:hypothetical protein
MNTKKMLVTGALAAALTAGILGGGTALAHDDGEDRLFEGSLRAPAVDLESDLAEDRELRELATVGSDGAKEAALEEIPGEATRAEIEEENGYVVWVVDVTAKDGDRHEVTVDAGDREVLASELDDRDHDDRFDRFDDRDYDDGDDDDRFDDRFDD